jgi:TctA family transporter
MERGAIFALAYSVEENMVTWYGSYALNNRLFDVWIMFAFGLAGFLLERCKVALASS